MATAMAVVLAIFLRSSWLEVGVRLMKMGMAPSGLTSTSSAMNILRFRLPWFGSYLSQAAAAFRRETEASTPRHGGAPQ